MREAVAGGGLALSRRLLLRREGTVLGYCEYEGRAMIKLRGLVGVAGLLVLAISLAASQGYLAAQRDPEVCVLEERGRENRERIMSLEASAAGVMSRLIRIETELEIARRATESNTQLMTGLVIGIGLMLVERIFVLFGWLKRREGAADD